MPVRGYPSDLKVRMSQNIDQPEQAAEEREPTHFLYLAVRGQGVRQRADHDENER